MEQDILDYSEGLRLDASAGTGERTVPAGEQQVALEPARSSGGSHLEVVRKSGGSHLEDWVEAAQVAEYGHGGR